jgi:hypothetical protein
MNRRTHLSKHLNANTSETSIELDLTNAAEVPTFDPDDGDDLYMMQEEAEQELVRGRYANSRRPLGRLEFGEFMDQ